MSSPVRRALPALVLFVLLVGFTSVVWYRVLHRSSASSASAVCPSSPVTVVPPASAVVVHVLNGTEQAGLASTVRGLLQQRGFVVADIGNDAQLDPGVAELRFGPKGQAAATLLSYHFPGATLDLTDQTDASVTIALGAKYTALAQPTAVSKALAAAKIIQSAPVASAPAPRSGAAAPAPSPSPRPSPSVSPSPTGC